MAQRTPGPWVWRHKSGSLHQVGLPPYRYGTCVLEPTHEYDSGTDTKVSDADAALIEASPDLLDALKEVMEWISNWSPNFEQDDEWPATASKARAAIAKATATEGGQ